MKLTKLITDPKEVVTIYKAWFFSKSQEINEDLDINVDRDAYGFNVKSSIELVFNRRLAEGTLTDANQLIADGQCVITILEIDLNPDNNDNIEVENWDADRCTATISVKGNIKDCRCTNYNVGELSINADDTGYLRIGEIELSPIEANHLAPENE